MVYINSIADASPILVVTTYAGQACFSKDDWCKRSLYGAQHRHVSAAILLNIRIRHCNCTLVK